jgi:hemolysin III
MNSENMIPSNQQPLYNDANTCNQSETPRKVLQEKGRNPYDGLRPWSAITHGVGALLAVLGTIILLMRSVSLGGSFWSLLTFSIYGISMIGLYTASTLYHCLNTRVSTRIALRKYDHISIYFLIAGTYTPICLIPLWGVWGWSLFGVIWALALAGLVMTLLWINAPRFITAGIYLFMGWLVIVAIYPVSQILPVAGMFWLVGGGILYTIGGVLYALKWPGRNNPCFGCHEVFHVFIVLGSFFQFMLMYRVIAFV